VPSERQQSIEHCEWVLCLVACCMHHATEWIIIGAFVGFSHIFLLGISIFKGLNARRLYKSFGFKG
jgi:hypothetical protein